LCTPTGEAKTARGRTTFRMEARASFKLSVWCRRVSCADR
jgi:hypothetical protein